MAEVLHPRERLELEGMETVDRLVGEALTRGRLHHAWLLAGPKGVGKASFAYRLARRLLGAAPAEGAGLAGSLASRPDDPVVRQVAARSHPDLMVIERQGEDGKLRKVIPVDEARKLPAFFSRSPGSAPYRVAIIDAVDDLNNSGANALLKTLEEPPERGVLLLVSHAPGALLPTLRSRCRRLNFAAPGPDAVAAFLRREADIGPEDAARLARIAATPGEALMLWEADGIAMDEAAQALVSALPRIDRPTVQRLIDGFRGGEGAARFALLFDRLAAHVRARALRATEEGGGGTDGGAGARWAAAWPSLERIAVQTEAINLDRGDALMTALGELRAAAC